MCLINDHHNVGLSSFSAVEVKIYLNLEIIHWHKLSWQSPPHDHHIDDNRPYFRTWSSLWIFASSV